MRIPWSLSPAIAAILLLADPHSAGAKKKAAPKAPPVSQRSVRALREGAAAFFSGDYEAARRLLLPVASAPLRNADYALYMLSESEALLGAEQGDPALLRSARERFLALAKLPGRFQRLAAGRAADCSARLGPREPARAALLAVLKEGSPALDQAALRFRLAGLQDEEAARAQWRRIYVEHPAHPLAEAALQRLRPPPTAGPAEPAAAPIIEPAEHLARARALTSSRRWSEALEELGRLPAELPPALQIERDYWEGRSYYRMRRRYDVAAERLLGVAARWKGERQAEAWFHGARALSRADKDEQAIQRYHELVQAHPRSQWAPEASFLAGWLEYNRGRYPEAVSRLAVTVQRYPGRFGEDARWYLAWSRYKSGDLNAALPDLMAVAQRRPHGDKAQYWAARALSRLGQKGEALTLLRTLVKEQPLSYYGQLARLRLREEKVEVALFAEAGPKFTPLLPLDPDKDKAAVAGDEQLARVDELLEAGLKVEAGYELRRAEGALLSRYGQARALPLLFDRYRRGENFQRPHQLGEAYGGAALRNDPHKVPEARAYWEQVYPLAYQEHVERYGPSGFNPPRYLYTIMQKESAYNPHDVSYADAIGLLQMIPPTSRRVATALKRPYTDDLLYDPEGNIQLGAWYIGRLLRKFNGQLALGAGSFNAGPQAMLRWLRQSAPAATPKQPAPPLFLDEFVEGCAYTQTREYMKKVLDIYAHYVYLWDKEEYVPNLLVDKSFLTDDGIDY